MITWYVPLGLTPLARRLRSIGLLAVLAGGGGGGTPDPVAPGPPPPEITVLIVTPLRSLALDGLVGRMLGYHETGR